MHWKGDNFGLTEFPNCFCFTWVRALRMHSSKLRAISTDFRCHFALQNAQNSNLVVKFEPCVCCVNFTAKVLSEPDKAQAAWMAIAFGQAVLAVAGSVTANKSSFNEYCSIF